jgi:glycosyltransferase involved in cell wall biosynthesis
MHKVLIVSPSFPPINAADMHRVRQALPYLREFGWDSVTLAVDPRFVEGARDPELLRSIPDDADVRHVSALDPRWTRRIGLGSLALRSLWHYRAAGNRLLGRGDIDLVYFSTTSFPVTVLGPYWKRRFGVPYVIDMQDPWYSNYYDTRPRQERPRKHWFSSRLNRYLEPLAMRSVDAVISVSEPYCETLRSRYANITRATCTVIPFGGAEQDFELLEDLRPMNTLFSPDEGHCNVVYVGRGGHDMAVAAHALFGAMADGLACRPDLFGRVRIHLIGTHYSREDAGAKTFEPIAEDYGLAGRVHEHPARVPYFTALELLREADMLVLPGSTSAGYTASKLYPYILSRRPTLAVFDEASSVVSILHRTGAGETVTFDAATPRGDAALRQRTLDCWTRMLERLPFTPATDWQAFEPHTARSATRCQAAVFDRVVQHVPA